LDTDDEMRNVDLNDINSEFSSSDDEEEENRRGT
jgi:hypothetical protein